MSFSKIVGQDDVISKLTQSVLKGRISHAQLFLERKGSGAFALAMAYVKFIACEDRSQTDSCGVCNSCKKIDGLAHPDLHFSFPIITDKKRPDADSFIGEFRDMATDSHYFSYNDWKDKIGAEQKQLIINVKEAERISKRLILKSFEGGYKFMLIWLPELMNPSSANKLLKLIEEPPPKTLIILISQNYEQIISTILSRTQLVKLNIPKDSEISQLAQNQFSAKKEVAENAARLADGNINIAISMLQNQMPNAEKLEAFSVLMRCAYQKNIVEAITWADQMHRLGREELKQFLNYASHMVRECIVSNYVGAGNRKLNSQEDAFASKFAPFINHLNVIQVSEELAKAQSDISRNGYAKIILLDMAIELFRLINPKS